MKSLDPNSVVPLYKQLKDLIAKQISEGVLKPNDRIPTEEELSKMYSVSRITVRKAVSELVEEDVLAKKQGKGTFVREKKITEDLGNPNSFTRLCERNGKTPGGRTLLFRLEEATDRDRKELELAEGEGVIHIQRLRSADGVPVMIENLYFPGHLKKILEENLDDHSLYQILRQKYNLTSGGSLMAIELSECTKEEAGLLQVPAKTPLLLVREVVYDQNNRPLHRTKTVLLGDKFKYISVRNLPKDIEEKIV